MRPFAFSLTISATISIFAAMQASEAAPVFHKKDFDTLDKSITKALQKTNIKREEGKACSIFLYRPESAKEELDFSVTHKFSHDLLSSFNHHDMRHVILFDSLKKEPKQSIFYNYSINDNDYDRPRQYPKDDVDDSYAITIVMDKVGNFPLDSSSVPNPQFGPYEVTDKNYDAVVRILPYTLVTDSTVNTNAARTCLSPQTGEEKECVCVGTYDPK